MKEDSKVILFDGVCNLCNGAVLFIIKRDTKKNFLFASLQSQFGQEQLKKNNFEDSLFKTLILINNQHVFLRSDAVLEIARQLDGLWPIFYIFKIIPRFIRDSLYNFVSRNRYSLFGKREVCMLPSEEVVSRFIES